MFSTSRFWVRLAFSALFFLKMAPVSAQLDTIHWIPPMHARDDWGPQYLYLSTPEVDAFPVSVRDGAGALLTTATISNSQPFRYSLGSSNDTKTLVPEALLQLVLTNRGLVIDGPKKFYAYFRAHSESKYQAGDLTCKGRAALGKVFRTGQLVNESESQSNRANFVGIMASEDGTEVRFSGFAAGTDFRVGGQNVAQNGPLTIGLSRGESVVFSQYLGSNSSQQPPLGFMGALVEATKPVAVNCGSWKGAPVFTTANDVGIDQIAPFEQVGEEYILCKGNGSEILEHPVVVAHLDGTAVYLNGASVPVVTLAAGGHFIVPTAQFSSANNLYIRCSRPAYVYQMIGGIDTGDDQMRTAGLIFVPPLSCGIPNAVDNIFEPNRIGSMGFEGGLMIVAMRDSAVTARVDGVVVSLGPPGAVPGNPDFVTYRNLSLFQQSSNPKTLSVNAQGAVQVAMFGRNNPASFAAFFSGFTKVNKPNITLKLTGDGVCPDTLIASGKFDGVQWMYEDSILQFGTDTIFAAYAPGRYIARGYLGVCRRTDFASDTIDAVFQSPEFPFTFSEPSCFGFSDGQIAFGQPFGGIAPYSYSIDNGKNFTQNPTVTGLAEGPYKLVARDSTGCYNRPLKTEIGQPDSMNVELVFTHLPDPLKPGDWVKIEARPEREVVRTEWQPADTSGCPDCLDFGFRPIESEWVVVTVFDTAGCPALDSIWVEVEPNVFVPNVFHPESSLGNERFTLLSREDLPVRRLAVFDRWGEQVFEKRDFMTNQIADGWDGSFRGKLLLPGVFVWVAEVEIVPGEFVQLRGDVTLVR